MACIMLWKQVSRRLPGELLDLLSHALYVESRSWNL